MKAHLVKRDQTPKLDLARRTVLITGASGGLGSTLARALHKRGATLALLDLDASALQAQAATPSLEAGPLTSATSPASSRSVRSTGTREPLSEHGSYDHAAGWTATPPETEVDVSGLSSAPGSLSVVGSEENGSTRPPPESSDGAINAPRCSCVDPHLTKDHVCLRCGGLRVDGDALSRWARGTDALPRDARCGRGCGSGGRGHGRRRARPIGRVGASRARFAVPGWSNPRCGRKRRLLLRGRRSDERRSAL